MRKNLDYDLERVVNYLILNSKRTDADCLQGLKDLGIDESLVSAYLVWIPMAFCRFMLRDEIQFPQYYKCFDPVTNNLIARELYSKNFLFRESYRYAEFTSSQGLHGNNFIAVAGRSAEFHAINQMELAGVEIRNIVLSEAGIIKTAFDEVQPEKKRWKFW